MRLTIFLMLTFLVGWCSFYDPLNYDPEVGVPEGSFAERTAWGEKHLGITYQQTIDWIYKAQVIQENVGMVTQVAPVEKPNYVESYFTDGLYGNHTIEIIGNKDKATLSVEGVAPCTFKNDGQTYICFQEGILATEYSRIPVHFTGVREVEFNRLNNQDEIDKLTKQIDDYRDRQPLKEAIVLEELLIERNRLYRKNEDFANAILDLESAIALLPEESDDPFADKDLNKVEKDNAERFGLYQYWLAQAYYDAGQFAQAADLFRRNLDRKLSRGLNQDFGERQLWLWITRIRAGQPVIANQELKQSLADAQQKEDVCYSVYGKYLLGDLSQAALIEQSKKTGAKNCQYTDNQRLSLAYYYIGQKEIAEGKIHDGRQYLKKLWKHEQLPGGTFEYDRAAKELSRIPQV